MYLNKIILSLFFALFCGIFNDSLAFAQDSDQSSYAKSNLQELENNFTRKIKTNLSEYLGKDAAFSVAVNFQVKKGNNVTMVNKSVSQDVGYLAVPSVTEASVPQKTFELQTANITLFLYKQYPESFKNNIKAIILGIADGHGFTSNIKLTYLPPVPIEKAVPEKTPTPVVSKNIWDYVRENAIPISILLGTIFFGLAVIIGTTVFSSYFKSSVFAVADSIKEIKQTPPADIVKNKIEATPVDKENNSESFTRNLKIISSIVEKSPNVFITAISEKENDYLGLKKILPDLFSNEGTKIQDLFSEGTIAKIEEKSLQANQMSKSEFYKWLDQFVERLTLNHMKKGNRFTRLIEREIVDKIFGLESEKLTQYALRKNSGIVFKIVLDFLPLDSVRNLFDRLTSEQWELVFDEKGINVENINKEAKILLMEVSAMKTDGSLGVSSKEAIEDVLITPIVSYLATKSLASYDEYLFQIMNISPEISKKIQEKIWSPSHLQRVPVAYLRKRLFNFNMSERESLIIGFSKEISELLFQSMPDGKMKQVLTDEIVKANGNYSKDKTLHSEIFCKHFLESMRESCANGEFNLLVDDLPAEDPPVFINKAA